MSKLSILLLLSAGVLIWAQNDDTFGSTGYLFDNDRSCFDQCSESDALNTGEVCACGLESKSKCMAECNGFGSKEIGEGSCDDFMCNMDGLDCSGKNAFCNWYDHAWSMNDFCDRGDEIYGNGATCVKPALIRGCLENSYTPVCGKGLRKSFTFANPCFAIAAGYGKDSRYPYEEGECTGEDVEEAMVSLTLFGQSPQSDALRINLPRGNFLPYFNTSVPEEFQEGDCGCNYDYNPVCLKTGLQDYGFVNECLANCRKEEQYLSPRQVYWPAEGAVLEDGECVEVCATMQCGENEICSNQNEGTAVCVPAEQKACATSCESEDVEIVCVSGWIGENVLRKYNMNKCYAINCLGHTSDFYFEGECENECTDKCTEEQFDELVCVYSGNIRDTVQRCYADCSNLKFLPYPCPISDDECLSFCHIGEDPLCIVDVLEDFQNFCSARCAYPNLMRMKVELGTCESNGYTAVTKSPTTTPTQSPTTTPTKFDACRDLSADVQASEYGTCPEYALGEDQHRFCKLDNVNVQGKCPTACQVEGCKNCDVNPELYGECGAYAFGHKGEEECPYGSASISTEDECKKAALNLGIEFDARQSSSNGNPNCMVSGRTKSENAFLGSTNGANFEKGYFLCRVTSKECFEGYHDVDWEVVATLGDCSSYKKGQKNYPWCQDDSADTKGFMETSTGIEEGKTYEKWVFPICPHACETDGCRTCDLDDSCPGPYTGSRDNDDPCIDDPTFRTEWGDCASYSRGGVNHGWCLEDKVLGVLKNCAVACDVECPIPCVNNNAAVYLNLDGGSDPWSCSDYWHFTDNNVYCENDFRTADDGERVYVWRFERELDKSVGDCCQSCECEGDDVTWRSDSGNEKCDAYHINAENSKYDQCEADGADKPCCYSCHATANTDVRETVCEDNVDWFRTDLDGTDHTCDSYFFGSYNHQYCKVDKAKKPCCAACASTAAECMDNPVFENTYGKCDVYGPTKFDHQYCESDTWEYEGLTMPVRYWCCNSCRVDTD